MAEISNLNIRLQNNKFAPIILPIIAYFNSPHTRPSNPYSALFVAGLLTERALNWGDGPNYGINPYRICTCGEPPGASAEWVHRETPCPECNDLTSLDGATKTLEEIVILGALDAGFNNPATPEIKTFEQLLGSISMHESNDYIFFQQMIDVFYENVSFMNYFLYEFENGTQPGLYMNLLGGGFREGFNITGLLVETISDGIPVTPATKATTRVFVGETGAPVGQVGPAPYFTIFSTDSDEEVFWMEIGGNYVQPAPPVGGGVTQAFHKITLANSTPETDIGIAVASAITSSGVFSAPTMDGNTVVVEANVAGTCIVPGQVDYTLATDGGLPNGSKEFTFADGTNDIPGADEVTSIDYKRATAKNLIGTWFKMYTAANDGVLFYYETPNQPINPAALGVAYTTAIAINVSANGSGGCYQAAGGISFACPPKSVCIAGECVYNAAGIEAITTDAIIGNGFKITSVPTYPCVDDCGNGYVSNKPCPDGFPCDGPREPPPMAYAALTTGDWSNSEGGTSAIGTVSQVNDVIAPDGTVFATDVIDDLQYAKIWNANVPAHMATKGVKIHYLKPVAAFPCICCIQTVCPGGCIIIDCPDYDPNYNTASLGSVMLQTAHPAITEDLVFNAPGNTFATKKDRSCPTCFM